MSSFLGDVGAALLLPPRDMTVSQWADENRVLTGAASAERGQWRTRPFQREPMDVLSPAHPSKMVVLLSSAQMLKTECLLNFLGFIADVDPGPALVVEPRIEDAKALSKDRVAPMFRATPVLRGKLATVKSRDSDNTVLHKAFTNGSGHVTFTGAISPSGLAMRPIRYALLDEVDRYPASAGTEGDPVSLAIQRTAEFEHNKKILLCSTPTIKGCSRIELAWLQSDQREYFVPCPHCGEFQVLELGDGAEGGLAWPEGHPEAAQYRCRHCKALIPEHKKASMVEQGGYRAQNPGSLIPGFRVNQLISPKRSWGTIATEFLAAKRSPETLKAFMNTVLATLWEEKHEVVADAHALWNRCEPFAAEVPEGACLLTAGVDVQADRIELEIASWGRDEESWSVAYHVIPGDILRNEVWAALDEILLSIYTHENGQQLRVQAACIDSGYKDATVLRFTRDRYNRRVFATKGRSGDGTIWPHKPSRKNQTPFFMIGVNAAKDAIHDRLKVKETGASFCHFPLGRDLEYFEQLTAEKKFIRYHNGFAKHEWRKADGARNEALDCRVYAYAALKSLGLSGAQLNLFCDRFAKHGRRITSAPPPKAPQEQSAEQPQPAPRRDSGANARNPFLNGPGGHFLGGRPNWFGR
jgi:phage terminase large subunit GpA-like protein